jgi:hypothetical protein
VAHPHQRGMGTAANAIASPPAFDTCIVAHAAILQQPRHCVPSAAPAHDDRAAPFLPIGEARP